MAATSTPAERAPAGRPGDRAAARWWVLFVLGIICVAVGAVLIFRPFTSLSALVWLIAAAMAATGLSDLLAGVRAVKPPDRFVIGVAWLLAAVLVLAWAGATLRALAVGVGILLIVGGLGRVVAAPRGTTDERLAARVLGVAEVLFGVLALSWPDLTLLVVAVVFGARTAMFGLSLFGDARAARRTHVALPEAAQRSGPSPGRPWWRRLIRLVTSAVSLAVAVALLGVSAAIHAGKPVVGEFYTAPRSVPDAPGRLIRSEPYTTAIPAGGIAWRILYTTTREAGQPAVASAIVMRSTDPPAGPRPVIAWAHGTTGFAENCAPSILDKGLEAGALPAAQQILSNGWVLVATDYVGLGTQGPQPYLIGQGEARSVLDAVRAARQLEGVTLSDRTVVWGHSQGGGAALWTGGLQPSYAPDVPLAGVAALAPASDLPGLAGNLDEVRGGSIFAAYVVASYTRIYPDVKTNDYVRPAAQTFVHQMSTRCLAEPEILVSVGTSLTFNGSIFRTDPARGALGRRLEQNTATLHIPAPLLIAQGATDTLVRPDLQERYAERLCDSGQPLEYRAYPGRDHVSVVASDSALIPYLVGWTADRITGKPAPRTC